MAYTTEIILPGAEPRQSAQWSALALNPNDPAVVAQRAKVLSAAWRPPTADRIDFICARAAGRSVLDVGCVAHDEARMVSTSWLHRRLAEVADRCLGVDVLGEAVETMQSRGYDAIAHDLASGLGPIASRGLFQVIVAGELIEHVANLDMLFATAAQALTADGELIVTTPNPYAPARVRAGQRGDVWENVDHIAYAFPSGIAELASRHGLLLAEALTTEPVRPTFGNPLRSIKRAVRRTRWHRRGFSTTAGDVRPVVLDRRDPLDWLRSAINRQVSSRHQFVGETFIYVIQRGPLD